MFLEEIPTILSQHHTRHLELAPFTLQYNPDGDRFPMFQVLKMRVKESFGRRSGLAVFRVWLKRKYFLAFILFMIIVYSSATYLSACLALRRK